jgi:hypothetical protein
MLKRLTTSAATGFLLLGAPGVAMAQEFPPLVVFGVQTTANIEVDIVEGDPCVEALQALRAADLRPQETNVIQRSFLVFVLSSRQGAGGGAATLVCAPEGTEPPAGGGGGGGDGDGGGGGDGDGGGGGDGDGGGGGDGDGGGGGGGA